MSVGESDSGPIYPRATASGKRYLFYVKHHRAGSGATRDSGPALWRPEISEDEEFRIFEVADDNDLSNERGNLYGIGRYVDGKLMDLGTRKEQVAEFPYARPGEPGSPGEPWHGYPLYPLRAEGPENRRGEKYRPTKAVFRRMVEKGVLCERDGKRLAKGHHT